MSTTRFLSNDALWSELRDRVTSARSVKAAVAFVGAGGADLLPLKRGDTLVVNLGMQTVRQGITAPKEIQRLIRRGVHVFTRSTLHAKFFICDGVLLVGSANVSRNSQHVLDEAASLTTDGSAILRATGFFDKLCTEPVRPEYLKLCLKAYRPPLFSPVGSATKGRRQQRVIEAKLWFIGGLRYREVPEHEKQRAEQIQQKAAKRLRKVKGTIADFTHYGTKPNYFSHIRAGDWVVTCIADGIGNRFVHAPRQVLGQERYARGGGKQRHLLLSEAPTRAQEMSFTAFRRKIRRIVPRLDSKQPRTTAIQNSEAADFILSLWTPGGRLANQ